MPALTTRAELKEWALRELGYPVVEINVNDQQLEDRIDESLQYFNEWHYEGYEKIYTKHKLTASTLTFAAPLAPNSYLKGEQVIGSISGAKASVFKQKTDNTGIEIWKIVGTFVAGETIIGQNTSLPLAATNFHVAGDFEKRYINIPSTVMSVARIFPISATAASNFLFDPVYYHAFDLLWNFGSLDLTSYEFLKERINLINEMLVGQKPVRFNRYMEKLYIDLDWERAIEPEYYIIIECYRILDPAEYPKLWDNYFLKKYTAALFREQWGNNLIKFAGVVLMGGVTLNGERILEQAKTEKTELEEQMKNGRFCEPLGFYMF